MNWYYVEAGQQAGPVDDAQLDELRRAGRIQDDTLVWRDGLANWIPYSQAKTPVTPAPGTAPPVAAGSESTNEAVCIECGRIFNKDEMIRQGQGFVCAGCKPVFMQKLREGIAGGGAARTVGTATLEEVLARDYEHDLGGYLSRGWEIFKGNTGLIIGASVLIYMCILAANMVPYVGGILSIIFTGPLMGGLWIFYLKNIRSQQSAVGDAFSGFGPRFGQMLLAKFIPGVLAALCLIPAGIIAVIGVISFAAVRNSSSGSGFGGGMGIVLLLVGGLLALAGLCGMVYFSTCWTFTLPLVADKGMSFWPAMSLSRKVVIKHWWMTFLVVLVIGLVGSAGLIACLVGVLVSGPVAFAALGCAYDKLFGDLVQGGE